MRKLNSKKHLILFLSLLLFLSACSTSNELYPREDVDWSPMRITDGPAAISFGALAPATCGLVTTAHVLASVFKEGGQAGLAIPFLPFVTAFGVATGLIRGTTMIILGTADTFTGSAWTLSYPFLNISEPGIGQWCFCFTIGNCKSNAKVERERKERELIEKERLENNEKDKNEEQKNKQ